LGEEKCKRKNKRVFHGSIRVLPIFYGSRHNAQTVFPKIYNGMEIKRGFGTVRYDTGKKIRLPTVY